MAAPSQHWQRRTSAAGHTGSTAVDSVGPRGRTLSRAHPGQGRSLQVGGPKESLLEQEDLREGAPACRSPRTAAYQGTPDRPACQDEEARSGGGLRPCRLPARVKHTGCMLLPPGLGSSCLSHSAPWPVWAGEPAAVGSDLVFVWLAGLFCCAAGMPLYLCPLAPFDHLFLKIK